MKGESMVERICETGGFLTERERLRELPMMRVVNQQTSVISAGRGQTAR